MRTRSGNNNMVKEWGPIRNTGTNEARKECTQCKENELENIQEKSPSRSIRQSKGNWTIKRSIIGVYTKSEDC